jgi:hypothetical protein
MVRIAVVFVVVGFVLVGGPFVLVGAVYVRRGIRRLRAQAAIEALPLRRVVDIQAGERAKLAGRAAPATGEDAPAPVTAGFTGAAALAARYVIEEERPDGDGGTDRREIHDARRVVPFRLVDDTGSVAVDPEPDVVQWADVHRDVTVVNRGEEPPERIRSYVAATPGLDPAAPGVDLGPFNFGSRERRYTEYTIRPDDDVVAVGPVERDPDAPWGDSLVVRPTTGGPGFVRNGTLAASETYGRLVGVGYLLGGTLLVGVPLAVLGYMLLELNVV